MSVVVSMRDAGPCRKELTVQVPAAAVAAETERVTQEMGKQARIPGFRKGKVPAAMVRKRYDHDIRHEVLDRLVPRFWRQAQAETSLDPLLPPRISGVELKTGEPLRFVATVEVRPAIELRNVRDFNLPELDIRPSSEEEERALEDLRVGAASWSAVERAAARGDRVAGSVLELDSPEAQPMPVEFEPGDPAIWEELSLAATGLAPGQQSEFERSGPPAVPNAPAAPATPAEPADPAVAPPAVNRRYRLRVETVRERQLPALDDAFATKVGNFASAGALRVAVAERIGEAKRIERRRRRETAVLDQLRERHPLELPGGVVEQEQEGLLREYAETMARQGVDPEQARVDWQQLAEQVKPQAEKRVHAKLLLDAIADSEGIAVGEDAFERALAAIARVEGISTGAVRQALDQQGRLQPLRAQLRREMTLARLIGDESPLAAAATPLVAP